MAELDDTRLSEFGLDWLGSWQSEPDLKGTLSGGLFVTKVQSPVGVLPLTTGPSTDGQFRYDTSPRANGNVHFMTTLRAMEERGAARVLASPNLVAASGDSSSFLAGGEFPVPIANASETGTTVTIQWKEFGVRLGFVPTVLDSNRIRLYVAPEVSAPDQTFSVPLNGYIVPSLVTRRATTTVELGDRDVLVIGGLKQTEVTKTTQKFPILGDIPIIRFFFTHKTTQSHVRDLVIAVSPQIIRTMMKSFPAMPGDEPEKVGQAPAPKK